MSTRLIAIAAFSGLAAFSAQAFQGEQNPLPPQPFQSMQARSAVQAEALNPLQISNGGTGVQPRVGKADRAEVRAGALAITANGAATYGNH